MKKFKIIIGLWTLLTLVLTIGCVEEFEADVDEIPDEGLVVEGSIISDSTVVFQLSKTLPLKVEPENLESFMNVDAEVSVKGSDGTSWSGERMGKGQFQVAIGTLKPEVEYHLEIQYEGEVYQSNPQKPLETIGVERMSYSQTPDGVVRVLLDTQRSEGSQYCLWFFEEDWEVHAAYATTALYDIGKDRIVYYDYPPVAQGWIYKQTNQILLGSSDANVENRIVGKQIHEIWGTDNRLSVLYSIRVRQRTLTLQEYEYYQVRVKMDSQMGGLFTPQPTELPTNITCSNPSRKVVGYVGCNMGVTNYQLYISGKDVDYTELSLCEINYELSGSDMQKYSYGYQVVNSMGWARMACVDVRFIGADPKGRPSWWPNPYLYPGGSSDDEGGL